MTGWRAWSGCLGSLFAATVVACAGPPVTEDGPPFSVVATTPGDGARGVPRGASLSVLLSHAVDPASLDGDGRPVVRIGRSDSPAELPGTWSAGLGSDNHRLTFVATPGLVSFGARLQVEIPASLARAGDGRALGRPVTFSFETERLPALRVVSTQPLGGGLLERVPSLSVTFSEPPDCADFGVGGAPVVGLFERRDPSPNWTEPGEPKAVQGRWACATPPNDPAFVDDGACSVPGVIGGLDYCTVRFVPVTEEFPGAFDALRLAPSSRVELRLPGDDISTEGLDGTGLRPLRSRRAARLGIGGTLSITRRVEFRVAAPPALQLVRAGPPLGRASLAPDEGLTLTFSEPPACASLEAVTVDERFDEAVAAALGAASRPVEGRWSCTGRPDDREAFGCARGRCEVTLTPVWRFPDVAFRRGSILHVTVPGGADDQPVRSQRATSEGGALAATVTIDVPITPPPPLVVRESLPSTGTSDLPPYPTFEWSLSEPPDCDAFQQSLRLDARLDPAFGGELLEPLTRWTCRRTPLDPGGLGVGCGGDPDPCHVTLSVLEAQPPSTRLTLTIAGGRPGGTAPSARSARATSLDGWLVDDWSARVRTSPPPPLSAWLVSPADGSEEIPERSELVVGFSQPVRCDSLADGIEVVSQRGTDVQPVEGFWQCSTSPAGLSTTCELVPESCSARFVPSHPFARGARVFVDAAAGAEGGLRSLLATAEGGWLGSPLAARFHVIDPRPPRIVGVSPAPGSRLGSREDALALEVDPGDGNLDCDALVPCNREELTAANACTVSVHAQLADGTRLLRPLTLACDPGGRRLFVTPDLGNVPWGAQLHVSAPAAGPAALSSLEGDRRTALASTWTGVVLMPAAPALEPVAISPWPGARDVAATQPISIRFSRAIDCASIHPGRTIRVREIPATAYVPSFTTNARDLAFSASCAGDTLTLAIADRFAGGARVEVSLASTPSPDALRSADPGGLSVAVTQSQEWSFEVAPPSAPTLVAVRPPNGSAIADHSVIQLTFSRSIGCSSLRQRLRLQTDDGGAPVGLQLTCGDGSTQGTTTDGAVALATVQGTPTGQRPYRLVVEAGVPATDAIISAAGPAGLLADAVGITYLGALSGHMRLESSTPAPDSTASPQQPLVLQFDRAIAAGTLVPCLSGGFPAGCNVWVSPVATPFREATRALAVRSWSADGRTAVIVPVDAPSGSWGTRQTLVVTVEGGSRSPSGTDDATLPSTITFTISTGDPSAVLGSSPADRAPDVSATATPCVTFADDLVAPPARLARLTALGTDGLLRFDAIVETAVDGTGGLTANRVCAVLPERAWVGHDGRQRLPPSSAITLDVAGGLTLRSGLTTPPVRWQFATREPLRPPTISGLRANVRTNLGDGPVHALAALELAFNSAVDPATLPAGAITVTTEAGANVPCVVQSARSSQYGLEVRPQLRWPPADESPTLTLRIAAGEAGPRDTNGSYLDLPVTATFQAGRTPVLTPIVPDGNVAADTVVQFVLTGRPLERFATDALRLRVDESDWPALSAAPAALSGLVVLSPLGRLPTRPAGALSFVTLGIADDLGQPVRLANAVPLGITAPPPVPAVPLACDNLADCPLEPAPDEAREIRLENGKTSWSLRWSLTAPGQVPLLPLLALSGATGPLSWLLEDDSTRCATARSPVSGTLRPTLDSATNTLRLTAEPQEGTLVGGCRYVGVFDQARLPNAFGELPATRTCGADAGPFATSPLMLTGCPAPGRAAGFAIVAEDIPPSLSVAGVIDRQGRQHSVVPGGTVPGSGTLRIEASEPLLAASVTATSVVPLPPRLSADGRAVSVSWTQLQAGASLEIVLEGLTDRSRNPAPRLVVPVSIERTPATLDSLSITSDPRGPAGAVVLQFSEPLRSAPGSTPLGESTTAAIQVRVGPSQRLSSGALRTVADAPDRLLWLPLVTPSPGDLVTVSVDDDAGTQLADDAGNGTAAGTRSIVWL